MKNIETILAEAGVEITDEQKTAILSGVKENYKTVVDYQKQVDKANNLQESLDSTKEELKKFEGVKPEELNQKIAELTKAVEDKETEWQTKIAERDFNDLIDRTIVSAKGRNTKAIKALLDLDALRTSKNQEADVVKAVKDLTEKDDSKMLFEATKVGSGTPIGVVKKDGSTEEVSMHSALAEHYK